MSTSQAKSKGFNPKDFYTDTPVSGIEAEELLSAVRLELVCHHPFFGKVALNMNFVESEQVPTTAVDARGTFYYNREWVNSFTKEDALFETGHEVMHLVQRLWNRMHAGVNHGIWNLAADYLADTALIDAGFKQSKASKLMVTPEIQKKAREDYPTVPAMYKHLLEEAKNNTDCPACKKALQDLQKMQSGQKAAEQEENKKINSGEKGSEGSEGSEGACESSAASGACDAGQHAHGSDGGAAPQHTCGNVRGCCAGTATDASQMDALDEQKWIEVVVGAKIHAQSKGNMPAGLGEYIDELTKSRVRWQDYLKAAATRLFGRDRYTFKRSNRRGPAVRLRLPGHTPDGKTAIGAIDTSASMSTEEVKQCISEWREIMRTCGCKKMWLILHDSRVYFSGWVEDADLTKLKMARGGTSHEDVFAILERKYTKNEDFNIPREEEVTLAILFTDLGTTFPNKIPEYEVIWGVPSGGCPGMKADVPFGKKVEVDLG